jgi:hypothetical protein
MTALGQSRHFGRRPTTSGPPLETDIVRAGRHVSKVPDPDIVSFVQLAHRKWLEHWPKVQLALVQQRLCLTSAWTTTASPFTSMG